MKMPVGGGCHAEEVVELFLLQHPSVDEASGAPKERVGGPLSYVCYERGYASSTDAVPATSSLTAHAEPVELSKHMSGARRPSRPMLSVVALETSPQQRPENVGASHTHAHPFSL